MALYSTNCPSPFVDQLQSWSLSIITCWCTPASASVSALQSTKPEYNSLPWTTTTMSTGNPREGVMAHWSKLWKYNCGIMMEQSIHEDESWSVFLLCKGMILVIYWLDTANSSTRSPESGVCMLWKKTRITATFQTFRVLLSENGCHQDMVYLECPKRGRTTLASMEYCLVYQHQALRSSWRNKSAEALVSGK